MDPGDPREWSAEEVSTFVRSLGNTGCFQSVGYQVLNLGVDDSVFFGLSLNELQGVCGHAHTYPLMSEYKHNNTGVTRSSFTSKSRRV